MADEPTETPDQQAEENKENASSVVDTLKGFVNRGDVQQAEQAVEEEGELPDLVIDRQDFELNLPQNQGEAEQVLDEVGVGVKIPNTALEAYESGNVSDADRLLRNWASSEQTVKKEVDKARKELRETLEGLEDSLKYEDENKGYTQDWAERLDRVLNYLEFVDSRIPNADGPSDDEIEDIFFGTGRYEITVNQNFNKDNRGLEYTELDGVETPNGYTPNALYGLAHALEDVKKINRNHLSPLVENEEDRLNETYNTLQNLDEVVLDVESSFWDLFKVRLNLEAMQKGTDVAEEIAESAEVNDWGEEMKNTIVKELEDGEHELQIDAVELERKEAKVIKLFDEALDTLQENFRISEYEYEQASDAENEISGGASPTELFTRLNNTLGNDSRGIRPKLQEMNEEFDGMKGNIEELRKMDIGEFKNIIVAEGKLQAILEEVRNNYDFEQLIEEEEEEIIVEEEKRVERMEDIVNEAVKETKTILRRNFESDAPSEFMSMITELKEAGKRVHQQEAIEERDLKEDQEVEDLLEQIEKEINAVGQALQEKGPLDGDTSVDVRVDGNSYTGPATKVLEDILGKINDVEDKLHDEIKREEGEEEENILKAVQELKDAFETAKDVSDSLIDIKEVRNEMLNDLETVDKEEEGRNMYHSEIRMIGGEEQFSKLLGAVEGDQVEDLLEGAEAELEKNIGVEKKELEVLREVSQIEKDSENKSNKLKQVTEDLDIDNSEIGKALGRITSEIETVEQETSRLEEDINDELDLETEADEEASSTEDSTAFDDSFGDLDDLS
jgi:hypothetical protein